MEEEKPERISLSLHVESELAGDSEDVRNLNSNPSTSEISKSEDVDDGYGDAIFQNPEGNGSGEKRRRLDTDNLPSPILHNCFLCQIPKEQHELRYVQSGGESLPILLGWNLAGKPPIDRPIINTWICERHFPEAVIEVYKSLRITSFVNVSFISKRGDQIMTVCRSLDPKLTIDSVRSILFNFCRETLPKMSAVTSFSRKLALVSGGAENWRKMYPDEEPAQGPSTSAQGFSPSKAIGSQKRKNSELRPAMPSSHRCVICSMRKPHAEMHEMDKTHETLVMMIRSVLADEMTIVKAKSIFDHRGRCFTCPIHIQGTVREIYRNLGIRSVEELFRYQFDAGQMLCRLAKVLQKDITLAMLRHRLVRFCHVNEMREEHPRFAISYEDVDITKIGEAPSFVSAPPSLPSWSSGKGTVWEEEEEEEEETTEHGASTSEMNTSGGGVVDGDDNGSDIMVLEDSPPMNTSDPNVKLKNLLRSSSKPVLCSVCGETRLLNQLCPLTAKPEKLAILIIWIIDGGLSTTDAEHFYNIDDANQMMCTHHAQFTVDKIYEHLGVSNASSVSTCRIYARHKFMVTARAVCPIFWKTLVPTPVSMEQGLLQILSRFCKKYDSKERAAEEVIRAKETPIDVNDESSIDSQLFPAVCVICEELKPGDQLHPFDDPDEQLVLLTKCILFDDFTVERAETVLQSELTEFVCQRHFPETTTQMFASFDILRTNQITHCPNEKLVEWLRIGRMLRPNLQASVFKQCLQTFCNSTATIRSMERKKVVRDAGDESVCVEHSLAQNETSQTPPRDPPPRVDKFTCSLCYATKAPKSLRLTKLASEKQLLAVGWILMEKMTATEGLKLWKSEAPVLVCFDDFRRVIERIFVEMQMNRRGELPASLYVHRCSVMSVVHLLQPGLSLEVFRGFLMTWTAANAWSLELWKKGRNEARYFCSLCPQRVSESEIIRLKLRRDTLVLMMAWIHGKGFALDEARTFVSTQKYVCKTHLKEAAQIILKCLGVASIEQMPSVINEPLSKLLWYAQEMGQRRKILLKDVIGMIREFFAENSEIIEEETPLHLHIRSPQPSTSDKPRVVTVIMPKASDPSTICMLCHRQKEPTDLSLVEKKDVKLLLATGWMLMNKCSIVEAKRIVSKTPSNVCEIHFQETMSRIFEVLSIKSQQELRLCTPAQKQKLMSAVNVVNPSVRMPEFWEFLLLWNWENTRASDPENLKGSKESPTPSSTHRPRQVQDRVLCSICQKRRPKSEVKFIGTDTDKLVFLAGCVLTGLCSAADAKPLLTQEFFFICSAHCPDVIDAIHKSLKENTHPTWMDGVMSVVNKLRPGFSTDKFAVAFRDVVFRNKYFKEA